ncbi:MAG: hypothetical protein LAN70_15440 [Acidobacteriia bacterium]|nr:hypothetical protein [Terriglobia bacterium]
MATDKSERLLARLEESKRRFGPGEAARAEMAIAAAGKVRFRDAQSLIRFHDALLFSRAFPQGPGVVRISEALLAGMHARVEQLRASGADMSAFDDESVSGIAGIEIVDTFPYEIAAWLAQSYPQHVEICWDADINSARLANTWPRFMPLLDEDGFVEPDVPYREWLDAARGNEPEVAWLLRRFASLNMPERGQAELYESLQLPVQWNLGGLPASRTLARGNSRPAFFHREPLIRRGDVSLARELASPLSLETLSPGESAAMINMGREVLTVRYRGLYGMTFGAPPVYLAEAGRGTQIFIWGLPPSRRFPLRTYAAGFTLKNGIPINYLEAIALADWMEIGFNTFYAFREGETGWTYAQVLRALRQLLGMDTISVYPYQLGADNEEAIASGAFWFYRKLGFRPGRPELAALVEAEEKKIAADPRYRTPARTLRKLAAGHVFFEMPRTPRGDWDRFRARTLGMAVLREMAKSGGDPDAFRSACTQRLASALNSSPGELTSDERYAFSNFALSLNSAADLRTWTAAEKAKLLHIIRAKMADEEWDYLRLMREHPRLRQALIRLGSPHAPAADV